MEAIVLAGGLGTRLKSVSGDVPKPLVDVCGKPFLFHVLDNLAAQGFTRAILGVSYRAEVFTEVLGEKYRGMEIEYSIEPEPLGTGGAIAQALGLAREQSVFVLNGDTFVEFLASEMLKTHQSGLAPVSMALVQVEDAARYGRVVLSTAGTVTDFEEKGRAGPGLINAGVYLLERALPGLPSGKFSFETEFLQANKSTISGFVVDGYFIDIGIPEDYYRACEYFCE